MLLRRPYLTLEVYRFYNQISKIYKSGVRQRHAATPYTHNRPAYHVTANRRLLLINSSLGSTLLLSIPEYPYVRTHLDRIRQHEVATTCVLTYTLIQRPATKRAQISTEDAIVFHAEFLKFRKVYLIAPGVSEIVDDCKVHDNQPDGKP
jgi:hypothetical protein